MFQDRHSAVHQLLPLLEVYRRHSGVVVALPRGGVPMGAEVASFLQWPMHVLSVKKLPHPDNPEYAIGAVGATEVILDETHDDVDATYVHEKVKTLQSLIRKREESYHQGPLDVRGKTVIIVDDGIATGQTMRCAVSIIRAAKPRSIIIAVPVAASEAVRELHALVDEFIVLHVPVSFGAVGEWYTNFTEVTDTDVQRYLDVALRNGALPQPLGRALLGR